MKEEAKRMKEQATHIQHSFTFIWDIQAASLFLNFLTSLIAVVTVQVPLKRDKGALKSINVRTCVL